MTESQELLIRLVAEQDALFRPLRRHEWASAPTAANIYLGRTLFARVGIPQRSGEASAAARTSFMRLVGAAVKEGLVTVRRLRSIRWPCLRPTDAGDDLARALADVSRLDAAYSLVGELAELGPGWQSERRLVSDTPDWPELRAVEAMAGPALWRQWVEAHSDCHGHVRYRLLDAGQEALAAGEPALPTIEPDQEAMELYDDTFAAARARLTTAKPDNPAEIGMIPLPCSMPDGFGAEEPAAPPATKKEAAQ